MLQQLKDNLFHGHIPFQDSISHSVICQFIYWHWLDIVLAILMILLFAITLSNLASKPNGIIAKLVYGLVIEAEKDLGSKTGQLKKKQVISRVYKQLPVCLKFVINEATVSRIIDEAVHFMKQSLEQNNSTLASLKEESAGKKLTMNTINSTYSEVIENKEEAKG